MLFGLPKEGANKALKVLFPSERTSGTDTVSLGWFNEPNCRPKTEEITRKVFLWPKRGNVKEILISHLYMFPSGNNKFGTCKMKSFAIFFKRRKK